jgi:hypothetical protein
MTHRPVGSGVSFATSTTSAKSTAISGRTNVLRLIATGANAFVAIGTEPTATLNDYCIPSGTSATLAIDNGSVRVIERNNWIDNLYYFPRRSNVSFWCR